MSGIYLVVLDFGRKAGCEIIDNLKTEKRIKREQERIDKVYKEEIKRFYFNGGNK